MVMKKILNLILKKKTVIKLTWSQGFWGSFPWEEQYMISCRFWWLNCKFVLSSLFQVHGHHPSPQAAADGDSHQGGHLCHLGPGSPAGLPPGLLRNHGGHAQQNGVHDPMARRPQQGLWESVSRDDSLVPLRPFLFLLSFPRSFIG